MAQPTTLPLDTRTATAPQLIDIRGFARMMLRRRLWFIAFVALDIFIILALNSSPVLVNTWEAIYPGISITMQITVVSFLVAVLIGLIVAFGRISKNILIYNVATFYVEIFRGLPLLVIILIFAFVVTPGIADIIGGTNETTDPNGVVTPATPGIPFLDDPIQRFFGVSESQIASTRLTSRNIDPVVRIMFAFAITYGAFMSEVFRAGIESIGKGQMEAARSLGMTYFQAMRFIVLPQAIKNVLPALANNFILLLKDTSLASAVAVPEISHLTRQYSSNRFRYPEGLLVLSFIYANLTIILSIAVIWLESRLQGDRRED